MGEIQNFNEILAEHQNLFMMIEEIKANNKVTPSEGSYSAVVSSLRCDSKFGLENSVQRLKLLSSNPSACIHLLNCHERYML